MTTKVVSGTSPEPPTTAETWIFIVIAAAGILVVVLLLLIIYIRKRKTGLQSIDQHFSKVIAHNRNGKSHRQLTNQNDFQLQVTNQNEDSHERAKPPNGATSSDKSLVENVLYVPMEICAKHSEETGVYSLALDPDKKSQTTEQNLYSEVDYSEVFDDTKH